LLHFASLCFASSTAIWSAFSFFEDVGTAKRRKRNEEAAMCVFLSPGGWEREECGRTCGGLLVDKPLE